MDKNKLDGSSFNGQEELLNFLKSKAPEVFSEGKIDCKKLKNTLGDVAGNGEERYGISWAGKNDCFLRIQEQTTATLKPAKDESVNFNTTGNLFIEGDNLEVLKVLQRSYYGKVKMIYIDPPYNTGNDFIYNDKFAKSKDEYLEEIGERDGNGNTLRIDGLSKNTKDSGHYHSNWLNMMYPRLFLARNLLKQDGVIFVSIDDNEIHNLQMIMNEIFGEENFVANIIWQKKYAASNDAKGIPAMHDYIVVYQKSELFQRILLPRTEKQDQAYKYDDNDGKGLWRSDNLLVKSFSKTGVFPITNPNTGEEFLPKKGNSWRANQETITKWLKEGRIFFGKDGKGAPQLKRYLNEVQQGIIPTTWWSYDEAGHNDMANKELQEFFGEGRVLFDTPKPTKLIKRMLQLSTEKDDLVLDFFAGSGTTADAIMQLNDEDKGNRKWICVQLPELCDEESEAYKAGYKTIADIGKERIKRASKKIKGDIDSGLKVFKLDNSNFKIWQGKFENPKSLLDSMKDFVDNVKRDSTQDNLLYEIIIKSGLDLNVKIEEKGSNENKFYSVDDGKLIVYLGNKISKELASEFQKAKPEKIVCLDRCFNNNDQLKTNIMLQMEQEKIDFKVI